MNSRLYLLLFSLAIFILTAIGVVVVYVGEFALSFGLIIAYLIAYPCIFALISVPAGKGKLSWKRIFLLTFSITIIAIAVTSSVWTIVTPRWSFSVATDKTTYALGESVEITVSLENLGFITHSFTSRVSDPIVVDILYGGGLGYEVWFSPPHENNTEFSIGPKESLERHFIWNQTNTSNPWFWNQTYMSGTYSIYAWIPSTDSESVIFIDMNNLFLAWTSISITST